MSLFAFLTVMLVLSLVQVCRARAQRDRLRAQWRLTATRLGLSFEETELEWHLRGTVAGRWLELSATRDAECLEIVRVRIDLGTRAICVATIPNWFLMGNRVPIGDRSFERSRAVGGDEAVALAVLHEECRRATAWRHFVELRDGVAEWVRPRLSEASVLVSWARSIAQFTQALTLQPDDIPVRLAQNVSRDSEPEVRLRSLQVLFARYTQHEATQSSLKAALHDPTPAMRMAAANLLNDTPTFLALAAHDRDPSLRAKLIDQLREQTGALLWPVLDAALEHEDSALLVAAMRAAVTTQHVASFNRIAELAHSAQLEVTKAALNALCALAPSASESVLLELLRDRNLSRSTLAMDALGRVGTIAAIETLLRYTSIWRLGDNARTAIRRIQSRLSNVEAGRVALTQVLPGGALCLVDNR